MNAELGLVLSTVLFFVFMLSVAMGVPIYMHVKKDAQNQTQG